jgi:hypothetical protein
MFLCFHGVCCDAVTASRPKLLIRKRLDDIKLILKARFEFWVRFLGDDHQGFQKRASRLIFTFGEWLAVWNHQGSWRHRRARREVHQTKTRSRFSSLFLSCRPDGFKRMKIAQYKMTFVLFKRSSHSFRKPWSSHHKNEPFNQKMLLKIPLFTQGFLIVKF